MKLIQNILIYTFFGLFIISCVRVISLDTVFVGWNTTLLFAFSGLAAGLALYKPVLFKGVSSDLLSGEWINKKNQERAIVLLLASVIRIPLIFIENHTVQNITVILAVIQVIYVITLFNIILEIVLNQFKKS